MALLSKRIQSIKPSPTTQLSAEAKMLKRQGKDIISLTAGEPDFQTPQNIQDAAKKAIDAGHTKYTPVDGTLELKEAILHKFNRDNALHYKTDQIIVSNGAKHSLYNAYGVLLNPGDEVIIPAPYWVSYPDMALLFEAKPVIVETQSETRFKMTPQQLKEAITPKTKLLVLNTPSNPSGMSYSKNELKALAEILLKHPDIIILSDDIYEHILYTDEPFSNIVNACPELKDRTIIFNGVSKAYAMTGWRIGFAAGNMDIVSAMRKLQSQCTSNPCSISQVAATEALSGSQESIIEMKQEYRQRRDFFTHALTEIGFDCLQADGAFYAFVGTQHIEQKLGLDTSATLSQYFLDHAQIATVPGSAFGAEHHIRLSYATSMQNLEKAVERLNTLL